MVRIWLLQPPGITSVIKQEEERKQGTKDMPAESVPFFQENGRFSTRILFMTS